MRITMTTTISGTRNGVDWPPAGGSVDVPDSEAGDLIGAGLAVAAESRAPETAALAAEPETAAAPAPRKRTVKPRT